MAAARAPDLVAHRIEDERHHGDEAARCDLRGDDLVRRL
jgi:hypothetical protein